MQVRQKGWNLAESTPFLTISLSVSQSHPFKKGCICMASSEKVVLLASGEWCGPLFLKVEDVAKVGKLYEICQQLLEFL